MSKEKNTHIICIDTRIWTTVPQKAEQDGVSQGTIWSRITRARQKKQAWARPDLSKNIEFWEIPELGLTLVKK